MTLYDWMFPAPVVLSGRVLDEAGKVTDVQVEEVFRGQVEPGSIVGVNIKRANRYREDFQSRMDLDEGKTYLFLLEAAPSKDHDSITRYRLVRGVNGTREVPAEGAAAYLDAARQFAQLQSINSDELHWHTLGRMLEERNPFLLLTALDEFLKFRREYPELALRARPLLQHPRPEIREKALELCGRILTRSRDGTPRRRSGLRQPTPSRGLPTPASRKSGRRSPWTIRIRGSDTRPSDCFTSVSWRSGNGRMATCIDLETVESL
jgi:hypothetical protein